MNNLDILKELTDKLSSRDEEAKDKLKILEAFLANCLKKNCPHAIEALKSGAICIPVSLEDSEVSDE